MPTNGQHVFFRVIDKPKAREICGTMPTIGSMTSVAFVVWGSGISMSPGMQYMSERRGKVWQGPWLEHTILL
jgi:hypothetical protein